MKAGRLARNNRSGNSQSGMVAIMVTIILMLVITLIVIGFAQISRRNQRQALDRQLSSQAFYAAESGINDAAELIRNAVATGTAVTAKPDCASNGGGFYSPLVPVLDATNKVEYTCLIVDPTPSTLVYSSVGTTGIIVPITAVSGTIGRLTFTWTSKDSDTTTPTVGCPTAASPIGSLFPPTASWTCGYGVVRFDLVPTAGAALSASSLQTNTMTSFMVPYSSGGSGVYSYTAGATNSLIKAPCTDTSCTLTINSLSSTQYYLRITSLYKDVALQISVADASSNPLLISGAQAVIDATGKAQDVLRRIQVRAPLSGSSVNQMGDFAIQSTDAICKRFAVMDGFFQSDSGNVVPGVGATTTNPLCQ